MQASLLKSALPARSIFLVGMMGSGKTTVGRLLAHWISCIFLDLDQEIETRSGLQIPVIFDTEGETGFRKRETAMLTHCATQHNIVLATGGGTILSAENRALLRTQGIVVYLQASINTLYQRTCQPSSQTGGRPLLATPHPRATLRDLLKQREPLYREVAHLTLDTDKISICDLVKTLIQAVSQKKPV